MKYNLIVLSLIFGITAYTQNFSSEVFHEGFLVTSTQDTLKGSLKYDLQANALTLVREGKTKSFSSQNIFYFEILDNVLNNYRQFYSIAYHVNFDYKIPVFFEVVYEGKLSLLRREQIVTKSINTNAAYWGGANMRQNVVDYSYYFLDDKGNISFFNGKKKELLRYMSKKQTEIKQFIKENGLSADKAGDLIRITSFYNSI